MEIFDRCLFSLILIFLVAVIYFGAFGGRPVADTIPTKALTVIDLHKTVDGVDVREVVIDGCHYYKYWHSLTHVGNCPNHGYHGKSPNKP